MSEIKKKIPIEIIVVKTNIGVTVQIKMGVGEFGADVQNDSKIVMTSGGQPIVIQCINKQDKAEQ